MGDLAYGDQDLLPPGNLRVGLHLYALEFNTNHVVNGLRGCRLHILNSRMIGMVPVRQLSPTAGNQARPAPERPTHLVVLVHGLGGKPEDLTYLKQCLERKGGDSVLVHLARCNEKSTFDGVVNGGTRLASEVEGVIRAFSSLKCISIVGNSLGGLYSRYALKLLYRRGQEVSKNGTNGPTIGGLRPLVFMSIASPHLGVRRFTYIPVPGPLQPLASFVIGQTGSDLFLDRKNRAANPTTGRGTGGVEPGGGSGGGSGGVYYGTDSGGGRGRSSPATKGRGEQVEDMPPLLFEMATEEEFLVPLKAFARRRAYANRWGDFMVPYGTAAFPEPREEDGSQDWARGSGVTRRLEGSGGGGDREWEGVRGALLQVEEVTGMVLGRNTGEIVGMSTIAAREHKGGGGRATERRGWARSRSWSGFSVNRMGGRARMEEAMAAGLNSCGWEKVSVDFGGLLPLSHNKICALSRDSLSSMLYSSGRGIMDHAAEFIIVGWLHGVF
ncbi:unnamed protein product, partial [Discosporangium mesarthrocarpum]